MTVAQSAPLKNITLTDAQEERAARLHRAAIVVDGSLTLKQDDRHFELARAGGITATNHTVVWPDRGLQRALKEVNSCRRWIDAHPDEVLLVTSAADIHTAKRTGREGIIFGPQNTEMLGKDLDNLGTFYDLGVRVLQLTYQYQNYVGAGCGETHDAGLTTFGRRFVKEMNALKIVVDVSHGGRQTALDAMEVSSTPVIISHAHPGSVSPHVRAKDDESLKVLAQQGGVMGLTALSAYLYDPEKPRERPDLNRFVVQVQYLADLIGVDHIGIAWDFEETNTPEHYAAAKLAHPELDSGWSWEDKRVWDLTEVHQTPNATRALVAGGFSDEEITKILGGNFLRVFQQVWGA